MREAKEYGNQHGSTERSNIRKSKKTMSVPEMRRLLGLKKTDSYLAGASEFLPDIYCERTDAC